MSSGGLKARCSHGSACACRVRVFQCRRPEVQQTKMQQRGGGSAGHGTRSKLMSRLAAGPRACCVGAKVPAESIFGTKVKVECDTLAARTELVVWCVTRCCQGCHVPTIQSDDVHDWHAALVPAQYQEPPYAVHSLQSTQVFQVRCLTALAGLKEVCALPLSLIRLSLTTLLKPHICAAPSTLTAQQTQQKAAACLCKE